jgi:hypothetical protein
MGLAGNDSGLAKMPAWSDPGNESGGATITLEEQFDFSQGNNVKDLAGISLVIDVLSCGDDLHPGHFGEPLQFAGGGFAEQD